MRCPQKEAAPHFRGPDSDILTEHFSVLSVCSSQNNLDSISLTLFFFFLFFLAPCPCLFINKLLIRGSQAGLATSPRVASKVALMLCLWSLTKACSLSHFEIRLPQAVRYLHKPAHQFPQPLFTNYHRRWGLSWRTMGTTQSFWGHLWTRLGGGSRCEQGWEHTHCKTTSF